LTLYPPRRSLVACTALVLLAHVGVIMSVGKGQGSLPGRSRGTLARHAFSLVRVATPNIPKLNTVEAAPPRRLPPPPIKPGDRDPESGVGSPNDGPGNSPMVEQVGVTIYRPGTELDVPARPRSAPDLAMLSGLPWSGVPVRLRLFIDSDGFVVDTQVLQSAEAPDVIESVRRMFLSTSFTAGLVKGQPVPSFKDIELNVDARS